MMISRRFILGGSVYDQSSRRRFRLSSEADNGIKKPEFSRNPKYHDILMDEVYPTKESWSRMLFGKENVKIQKTSNVYCKDYGQGCHWEEDSTATETIRKHHLMGS